MKCIKNKKTGTVSRVEDKTADSSVTKGIATYCTKQEWKKSLTAKERKDIMDHNGGDPSVKKTDMEKSKAKGKKIGYMDEVDTVQTINPPAAPIMSENESKSEPTFPETEEPVKTVKTESKAKRNKKDKPDQPETVETPKSNKTDKKPMINKPKVKKIKE